MKVVFIDRDGVINQDRDDYVKNTGELKIFPYAPESIRRLNDAGLAVILISNQQGVAKGLIQEHDLQAIQDEINRRVVDAGGRFTAFYYCKHMASEQCACRKPQPGLLHSAAETYDIDLPRSFMIGDADRDIIAGKSAGCKTILVLSGKLTRAEAEKLDCSPDYIADDLAAAVDIVLSNL